MSTFVKPWGRRMPLALFGVLGVSVAPAARSQDLPDRVVSACLQQGRCEAAARQVRSSLDRAERRCARTRVLEEKVPWLNELLRWQKIVDELGLDAVDPSLLIPSAALCDGLLDDDVTALTLTPASARLAPGERVSLTPSIRCSNGTCEGALNWISSLPEVATVDQEGLVTAVQDGATTVATASAALPELSASARVEVETALQAEVVFLFETLWTNGWIYPELGVNGLGDELLSALDARFGRYRVGVLSYAHHASFADPENSICSYEPAPYAAWAPYQAATPLLPLLDATSPGTSARFVSTLAALAQACQVPPQFAQGNAVSSVYTALETAISSAGLGGWSEPTGSLRPTRAILVLGTRHVCERDPYVGDLGTTPCDTEAISGLQRGDVIRAAQAQGVQIYWIFGGAATGWYHEEAAQYWGEIATETGGALHFVGPDPGWGSLLPLYEAIVSEIGLASEAGP